MKPFGTSVWNVLLQVYTNGSGGKGSWYCYRNIQRNMEFFWMREVLTRLLLRPLLAFTTEPNPPAKIEDSDTWDVLGSQVLSKAEGIQPSSEHLAQQGQRINIFPSPPVTSPLSKNRQIGAVAALKKQIWKERWVQTSAVSDSVSFCSSYCFPLSSA